MKLGFSLLNNWGIDDAQALVDLACRAEEAGIDSVWVHDHVFNVGHVFDRIDGKPYYAERGAFTDEAIAVMRALWTQDEPKLEGKYARFDGMKFSPKPLQKPTIPIVIGGVSRPAIRRAARLDDGWPPLGMSPEALGQGIAALREETRAAGREAATIPVSIAMSLAAARAGRYALGTKPAEIIQNARAYASLGVETLIVSANTSVPREALSALEMIARDVSPALAR
jgi:alkanesulfonate monooxygenase SsuD/methylene tetrahydromethanopterin reductase-like flavin-dependent oxidoreductase (luciferase family)